MNRPVRISVKAVVVSQGRLLVVRHRDHLGDWFGLPGGGQRHGESLRDALERECLEETGSQMAMGRLLFVRDYIGRNHEFAELDDDSHQVELMFECTTCAGPAVSVGPSPDLSQVGVEWVEVSTLGSLRFYPRAVAEILQEGVHAGTAIYLGDVN